MITSSIYLVKEFHERFGHPVERLPCTPNEKVRLLRFRLLFEELMEFGRSIGLNDLHELSQEEFEKMVSETMDSFYIDEYAPCDLVEAADALGDIDYVCQGANLTFGFPAADVIQEIHRANMSKLGADGRPIKNEHGKTVKGPNYVPPDIGAILRQACGG